MRPILYEQNETVFESNGICILHDAVSAEVTEVRNGEFELELKYPLGGEWIREIIKNRYISVKPNDFDDNHAFIIYEVEKSLDSNEIIVKGITKTDELSGNVVKPLRVESSTPEQAWQQVKRNAVDPINYNFISDIQTSKNTEINLRNVLNVIAGEEGSFIDTWGGEIKRTNNTIYLYSKRGRDHVTTIRPRKNLKNVKVKSSMAGKFTRILPYAKFTPEGENQKEQIVYGDIIKSPHYDDYFIKRIAPLDISSEFSQNEGESKKTITPAMVTAKASTYFTSRNKDADKPSISVEVDMIPLQDSTDWDRAIIKALESVRLCDTVDVYVRKIDCDVTVKVRKIVYDVLRERIIKIEASSSDSGRSSLADQQRAEWKDMTNRIVNEAIYGEKDGLINTLITSANNKNKNFYGPDEPDRALVSKDDLWFKRVGSEGDVEMYRFDGEDWVLILDSNFEEKVANKVNDAIASVKEEVTKNLKSKVDEVISDAERRITPNLDGLRDSLEAKLSKIDNDINTKVTDITSRLESMTEELSGVNTSLEQKTNEIKIAAESLERKVDGNIENTSSEIRLLKDSISTKVSSTEIEKVTGKVTALETKMDTNLDGIKTTVNRISTDIDGKVNTLVGSAVTQSESRIRLEINSVNKAVDRILNDELPEHINRSKNYTDTVFQQVDGKIESNISNRLEAYSKKSDIETRITQEAGKIRTELSSTIDSKIPRKYGSRNYLKGTDVPLSIRDTPTNTANREGKNVLWNVSGGYPYVKDLKLKDFGFKVEDRINIQYKLKVNTSGATSTMVTPEIYSDRSYIQPFSTTNGMGLSSDYDSYTWNTNSDQYVTKVAYFNVTDRSLNESTNIRFRIDTEGINKGSSISVDIKDVMLWSGDLWTDYAPAQEDADVSNSSYFQDVLQTVNMYKRTLGSTEKGVTKTISQLIQTNEEIQSVVTNASNSQTNLIMYTDTFLNARLDHGAYADLVDKSDIPGVYGSQNYFYLSRRSATGRDNRTPIFISLPLAIDHMYPGETYTLSLDMSFDTTGAYKNDSGQVIFQILNNRGFATVEKSVEQNSVNTQSRNVSVTFKVNEEQSFDNVKGFNGRFSFRIKLMGPGKVGVKSLMLSKTDKAVPYRSPDKVSSSVILQTANGYAARSLNSAGDIVAEISANTDARIKGKNIILDGNVIANGKAFIKESWIENLNAAKITAGTLDAKKVNITNLNASNIVSGTMNAAYIRGGVLSSLNGDLKFDLDGSSLNFYNGGNIRFYTGSNAIWRQTPDGIHTAFMHFNNEQHGGLYAGFGVTSSSDGINSSSSGRFSGIRCFRTSRDLKNGGSHEPAVDRIEIYGDEIIISDTFGQTRGLYLNTTIMPLDGYINLWALIRYLTVSVSELAKVYSHLRNVGWDLHNADFQNAVRAGLRFANNIYPGRYQLPIF